MEEGRRAETCTSVPERSRPISAVAVAHRGVDSLSERKSQKPGKLLFKDKVGTEGRPENMTDLYLFFFLSRTWSFPYIILSMCLSLLSLGHPFARVLGGLNIPCHLIATRLFHVLIIILKTAQPVGRFIS